MLVVIAKVKKVNAIKTVVLDGVIRTPSGDLPLLKSCYQRKPLRRNSVILPNSGH